MYRDLELKLDLSELGDGCQVVVKNPRLLSSKALRPPDVPKGPDGKPLDPKEAERAMWALFSTLVVSWTVWDYEGHELPTPKDNPDVWDDVPLGVINAIGDQVGEAVNPQ